MVRGRVVSLRSRISTLGRETTRFGRHRFYSRRLAGAILLSASPRRACRYPAWRICRSFAETQTGAMAPERTHGRHHALFRRALEAWLLQLSKPSLRRIAKTSSNRFLWGRVRPETSSVGTSSLGLFQPAGPRCPVSREGALSPLPSRCSLRRRMQTATQPCWAPRPSSRTGHSSSRSPGTNHSLCIARCEGHDSARGAWLVLGAWRRAALLRGLPHGTGTCAGKQGASGVAADDDAG